ncbi:iron chaperone [Cellulomonas uda]|uniref:YdhG-like domain-containing protein n=1 Tax=Cellulomonas uda TaxID=1714 RepID=A0A4Y3KAM0_CELUD|nr:hypothetical protein [Cellulomonas uda]NII67410.1 uncharacterized protein YdhG (YjbR/CyaY superfamily) [Cellulomonas uda]GEA79870.1 hypothetical protein CUD01_03140 [Cellulomonas uda]
MAGRDEQGTGFTDEEKAAVKERAKEARAAKKMTPEQAEAEVLAKIAELPDDDRAIAEAIHRLVRENAPELTARTWYGMPAYAKGGKVLAFYQPASKFKARYGTLGFNDPAALDDGPMWATTFAITALTPDVEARVADLLQRAAG